MSATIRASRSPLRRSARRAGASGSIDGEEPDPQVGQDVERRAVGDVALEVAERRARDGQDAHRGDGQRDLGDVGDERRLRDEVGGHRHQARRSSRRRGSPSSAPIAIQRRCDGRQAEEAADDRHGSSRPSTARATGGTGRRARRDRPALPVSTTRPASSTTTSSATSARRSRCETTSTVRPRAASRRRRRG